ncbi:MAG: cupin domain-containing protein [Ardenticatenaceae bacterium]
MFDVTIIQNLTKLVDETSERPISNQMVYKDDNVRVILFRFAAGKGLSEHTSDKPAVLHFLQGDAKVTLGDKTISAEAGTWVHMPPKLPHSIMAQTPVYMLLQILTGGK